MQTAAHERHTDMGVGRGQISAGIQGDEACESIVVMCLFELQKAALKRVYSSHPPGDTDRAGLEACSESFPDWGANPLLVRL